MRKKKLIEQIEFLEKELRSKELQLQKIKEELKCAKEHEEYLIEIKKQLCIRLGDLQDSLYITRIIQNKNATIVFLGNNKKIIVKKSEDDTNSIYTAVAYAIIKNLYGTNNFFKKTVDRRLKNEK